METQFIGKRIDNNQWIDGYLVGDYIVSCWTSLASNQNEIIKCAGYKVYADSIGQYVGLKDKHGKKIFTNHIVLSANGTLCLITLKDFEYIMKTKKDYPYHRLQIEDDKKLEIIGNIYDNADLLK